MSRPNWGANSWQDVLSVGSNSLRHLPRRSSKNCDLQFASTDRLKENYSIDCTLVICMWRVSLSVRTTMEISACTLLCYTNIFNVLLHVHVMYIYIQNAFLYWINLLLLLSVIVIAILLSMRCVIAIKDHRIPHNVKDKTDKCVKWSGIWLMLFNFGNCKYSLVIYVRNW